MDSSYDLELSVTEFVALLNQTLEYAYPSVTITGELANFKVSKNRWVYFDLKDDDATVRCFGTVYQLPGPLEDGMLIVVKAVPRLHAQYGFSLNTISIRTVGEGSIKKAAALLEAKLAAEGLFDPTRKRLLPYPPKNVGLITSAESAAYRDFVKVLGVRWGGVEISLIDVQVQGDVAPAQLVRAIEQFNRMAQPPDVLVLTRGGGSAEDLQAFSTEQVTRAVASSRVPTLVAIGHEVDSSLSELAADVRASTPSNAAELLVPDRKTVLAGLKSYRGQLKQSVDIKVRELAEDVVLARRQLREAGDRAVHTAEIWLRNRHQLLEAFDPQAALTRGYSLVKKAGRVVGAKDLQAGNGVTITFADGTADAQVTDVKMRQE